MTVPVQKTKGAMERAEAGYTLLGPIIHRFVAVLHGHLLYGGADTARLFVARAGVRIKEFYDLYCETSGLVAPPSCKVAWVSRILLAKGAFCADPKYVSNLIVREFPDATIRDVLKGLWRYEPECLAQLEVPDPALLSSSETFARYLSTGTGSCANFARQYFERYEMLVADYMESLVDNMKRIALVDSGWQGTIHLLLSRIVPEHDVVSLFFGRMLRAGEDESAAEDIVGLVVEQNGYDPLYVESSFIFHRHIIESLFEFSSPSIEALERAATGEVIVPQVSESPGLDDGDEMVASVCSYLRDHSGSSLTEVCRAYCVAMRRLHDKIVTPTPEDVQVLFVEPRSADFGREYQVPVVINPNDSDDDLTAEQRVNRALWPQGQIALEWTGTAAERRFKQLLAGVDVATGYFTPNYEKGDPDDNDDSQGEEEVALPVVAIVTRTKDRPLLLNRAAGSVACQTYDRYQWVVVNDGGSEKEVIDVIRVSGVEQDKIRLVSNVSSVGMEAASNLGCRAVDSDLIVIHDDDDSWEPGFLERTVEFLTSPAGLKFGGVITHSTYVSEEIRGNEVIIHHTVPYKNWVQVVNISEMAVGNFYPPIAFVFRREIFDRINGFDESFPVLGDWDFNLRFLRQADIGVLPVLLANYHHRDVVASGWYGNSVSVGQNLHVEYDALLRNRMARSSNEEGLVLQSVIGYAIGAIRGEIHQMTQRLESAAPSSRAADPGLGDDCWHALASVARNGRTGVQRFLDNILRYVFRIKTVSRTDDVESLMSKMQQRIKTSEIPVPPDFDDIAYLHNNPDVKAAVTVGSFHNGYHHYLEHGRTEGRTRPFRERRCRSGAKGSSRI